MKLISDLRNDNLLKDFICQGCSENGVGLDFNPLVSPDSYIVIHVDKYYNSLKYKETPPSPDCLVVQFCRNDSYVIYIVELKNIESLKSISLDNLRNKFVTCLQDFMSNRFRQYFYDEQYDFTSSINLLFVSLPKESKSSKKGNATRLDSLLSMAPIEFANKRYMIRYKIPNPILNPCQ